MPRISLNLEIPPLVMIANIGGALLLSDHAVENAYAFVGTQVGRLLTEFETLALVVIAPSIYMLQYDLSFVRVVDELQQIHREWQIGPAHHRSVKSFLAITFSDGREYTYQMNPIKFRAWYNEYEQRVIGRQDHDLDCEDENLDEIMEVMC